MKTLTIRWQRLVNKNNQTCPRCEETEDNLNSAFLKLKKALAEVNIEVELVKDALDLSTFTKDPLQSNCIWIGGGLLEEWIGGTIGKSKCCDTCAESECRTVSIGNNTFESIPENLIIRAGLLAAAELFINNNYIK